MVNINDIQLDPTEKSMISLSKDLSNSSVDFSKSTFNHHISKERGFIEIDTGTDFTTGELKATGNNLDLAIEGNDLFIVRSEEQNKIFFTNNGRFRQDAKGYIKNTEGHLLMVKKFQEEEKNIEIQNQEELEPLRFLPETLSSIKKTSEVDLNMVINYAYKRDEYNENSPIISREFFIYDDIGSSKIANMQIIPLGNKEDKNFCLKILEKETSKEVLNLNIQFDAQGKAQTINALDNNIDNTTITNPVDSSVGDINDQTETINNNIIQKSHNIELYGKNITFSIKSLGLEDRGASDTASYAELLQNGRIFSKFKELIVEEGIIQAMYQNNSRENIAKIAIARFKNPAKLTPVSSTTFIPSYSSGVEILSNNHSSIKGGFIESSNIDPNKNLQMLHQEAHFTATLQRASNILMSTLKRALDEMRSN
ncbi:MAG: flagellar hook-basal body complex protein [Rickettsia sp.]|nr:flagellar hook-basal body complex protein [Rickettsia sp.]